MEVKLKYALTGIAAGAVNGFFGGGGGMVLVPLLSAWCGLDGKRTFAVSVAAILPMCAVSAAVYLIKGGFDFSSALPFLIGGAAGGVLGGLIFGRLPVGVLRKIFAVLLIIGGVRCLF